MKNALLMSALILPVLISSCDDYSQDEYEFFYVVEAYMIAGRQLPHIILSTTTPADAYYSFEDTAVEDAIVQIRLLNTASNSEVESVFNYIMTEPGIYNASVSHRILPLRTYELNITFPQSAREITAHTTIPDTFHIKEGVPDFIVYRSTEQLEITVSESSYPGRQNIFVFNTISLRPEAVNLTPLYRTIYEDGGEDPDELYLLANNDSGIINEGNFDVNPDGTFTIEFPWLGFSFYEENLVIANTIDDNLYDFVRSRSVQLGGSSLSPGEIQNVISNINGGVGVFGAMASDTVQTIVQRPLAP
ncbi:MAG: DUF4249 family protein [Balneolaceae bacterium]